MCKEGRTGCCSPQAADKSWGNRAASLEAGLPNNRHHQMVFGGGAGGKVFVF